ncbi:MAG: hypothetical protein ABL904_20390, partial [Hyphomicrobiaceae bacterium]
SGCPAAMLQWTHGLIVKEAVVGMDHDLDGVNSDFGHECSDRPRQYRYAGHLAVLFRNALGGISGAGASPCRDNEHSCRHVG